MNIIMLSGITRHRKTNTACPHLHVEYEKSNSEIKSRMVITRGWEGDVGMGIERCWIIGAKIQLARRNNF